MFICLLKAHPWVLTHTSSTTKHNISSHRRRLEMCVCTWVCVGGAGGGQLGEFITAINEAERWDPFVRRGLICQWWAVKVLREERNKGAKRLCDNEDARRRAFKCGDVGWWGQDVPITHCNYVFVKSAGLVRALIWRCKDTIQTSEVPSLCTFLGLTHNSRRLRYMINNQLACQKR